MAKPSVYIETTIPSYLVSRPSRDMVISANQQVTREWWESRRYEFELLVSEVVREEILRGDPAMSIRRSELVKGIPVLTPNDNVDGLIRIYKSSLGLPLEAAADIAHIAYANGAVIRRLQRVNEEIGIKTPTIVTPYELLYSKEGGENG